MNPNVLYLVIAVSFWALNFYLGKIMLEYVSPNVAAFWRFLIGFAGILALTFYSIPSLSKIRKHIRGAALVGFVGLFGFIFFFTMGLDNTSAINGALIVALNPAITLILAAIFQGYRIRKKDVIGILLALIGVIYLLTRGNVLDILNVNLAIGDIYFLIAVVMFGLQNIWIRKYSQEMGSKPFTLLTNFFCLVAFTFLLFFEPSFSVDGLTGRFWVAALGMGIPGTALAYYTWNIGIKKVGPAKGAIFLNAIPLFVALLSIPFGASLYFFHLISFILIVSGLIIVQIDFRKPNLQS